MYNNKREISNEPKDYKTKKIPRNNLGIFALQDGLEPTTP